MAEPLSCPFCPKPTKIEWNFEPGVLASLPGDFHYYCVECGASGPLEDSQPAALAAWNRRADGWISVEERLPEHRDEVLIAGGDRMYDAEAYPEWRPFRGVKVARFTAGGGSIEEKGWWGGYGEEYDGEHWHRPTHWRPLPPPPGEGDDG